MANKRSFAVFVILEFLKVHGRMLQEKKEEEKKQSLKQSLTASQKIRNSQKQSES